MIIEFIFHWKEKYHWLYFPLIVSFFPLIHTIEIINRLIHILIPFMTRSFYFGSSIRGNIIICSLISIPNIFFILIFIPILQRIKYFGRILIILFITFFITAIIVCSRQSFTNNHPNIFYAKHISKSIFEAKTLSNVSLESQSSSILVMTFNDLPLSPILDQFSAKSGHELYNKRCFNPTNCTFDDTFNRTIAVQDIEIESMKNFVNYTIIVRHVLSYNIRISSLQSIKLNVRNQLNIPRTETIIDVTLNSPLVLFYIRINIKRCDLIDSPFLLLFTHFMPNMVLTGDGQCQAIDDYTTLIVYLL
jgi:hypothetical protein